LQYVHLSEWTDDDQLRRRGMYKEMLDVWGRYVGHVVTNVGGVYEAAKKPKELFTILYQKQSNKNDAMVASQCFCSPTWLVNVST
jgi:hypothetical protein